MKEKEEIMIKTRKKVGKYFREKYTSLSPSTVEEEVGKIIQFYKEAKKETKKTSKIKLHKKGNYKFHSRHRAPRSYYPGK